MRNAFFFPAILLVLFSVVSCKDKGTATTNKDRADTTTTTSKVNPSSDDKSSATEEMDNSSYSIVGKWHFINVRMEDGEEPTEKEREEMRGSSIEFKSDGHYIAITKRTGAGEKTEYGTYQFNTKAKTLVTTPDNKGGQVEEFDFKFPEKNRIILTVRGEKITVVMGRD